MKKSKNLSFDKEGIDWALLNSRDNGIWYHQWPAGGRREATIKFLELEVLDAEKKQVKKLLGVLERNIPNGRIIGNVLGSSFDSEGAKYFGKRRCFITIELTGFSPYTRKRVREGLEKQFLEQGIHNAEFRDY